MKEYLLLEDKLYLARIDRNIKLVKENVCQFCGKDCQYPCLKASIFLALMKPDRNVELN